MKKMWGWLVDYTGTPVIFFVLSGFMVFFFVRKNLYEEALLFTVIFFVTTSLIALLKIFFHVCRPRKATIHLNSYAFPSGHAASSTFFVLTTILLLHGHMPDTIVYVIGAIGFITIGIISISRVVLRVHTPLQVIAGLVLGVATPLLVLTFF